MRKIAWFRTDDWKGELPKKVYNNGGKDNKMSGSVLVKIDFQRLWPEVTVWINSCLIGHSMDFSADTLFQLFLETTI